MDYLSVRDMFKIGVGPSSSHTLGPWKAALHWIGHTDHIDKVHTIQIKLYGSLSLTGKGHATDKAIILGLSGLDPASVTSDQIQKTLHDVFHNKRLELDGRVEIEFDENEDIVFTTEFLDFHANALSITSLNHEGYTREEVYYSLGGGFISQGEGKEESIGDQKHPFPITRGNELLKYCKDHDLSIAEVVMANEMAYFSREEIENYLLKIWDVMLHSMYRGCHAEGVLPGGLEVKRRASRLLKNVMTPAYYTDTNDWIQALKGTEVTIHSIFKWVSAFAIAVNEENAAMGRVVTAPTNGSAGVIPAVLMAYLCFYKPSAGRKQIIEFLCVASEIGCIFKKGSTISAAMGGCQAEIGVSSAMAAAALCHVKGGSPEQCLIAAEVAMEHHLGMTCDPINGLVQIPCIERNSMGAIKAINAAHIALERDPEDIKVPFDKVVKTMWSTAQDMHRKYKETSEGGLAVTVNEIEC